MRAWLWPGAIALVAILLQASGGLEAFRWERSLAASEPWRLVSGQLVHLGWVHLGLNLAALGLAWGWFGATLGGRGGVAASLASGAAVMLGLTFATPGLQWYAGLSGVLHGLVAAGALAGLRRRPGLALAVLALLAAKLAAEMLGQGSAGTARLIGGPVVVAAHLYGALGGAAFGLWRAFRLEFRA